MLVHDAFPFGSRRVLQESVPESIRQSCAPVEFQVDACKAIADRAAAAATAATDAAAAAERVAMEEYNRWASDHEHVIAKSLLSAGLSWPGVLLAEDVAALDVLLSRTGVRTRTSVHACIKSCMHAPTFILMPRYQRLTPVPPPPPLPFIYIHGLCAYACVLTCAALLHC